MNEKLWQQKLLQRWCMRSCVSNWAARNRLSCCNHVNGSIWTDWWLIITARHLNVLSDLTLEMNLGPKRSNIGACLTGEDVKFFKRGSSVQSFGFCPPQPHETTRMKIILKNQSKCGKSYRNKLPKYSRSLFIFTLFTHSKSPGL